MAGQPTPPFRLTSIRGGVNNSDTATVIRDDEVADARNVDLRSGAMGSKRRGTEGISLSGSILDSPVVAVIRHTPSSTVAGDEIWAIDENGHLDRYIGGVWNSASISKINTHVTIRARNFEANGASLHGKLFIAAWGEYDRLIVWDGTNLRWAGFYQTPDPTVANTAGAGTYSGTRYIRIRYVQRNSDGAVLRRSEPSNVVSIVPTGTKDGIIVTKPAGTEVNTSPYCEGQTHWEVELSLDNILFYRVATVAIATSTYTDNTAESVGYSSYPLSEVIGEYIPPASCRHVAVDEDRLVMAGSYFTQTNDSTVWWTPVSADDGKGNDERIPTATTQWLTFDGLDGGRVTALVPGVLGSVYVFKLTRTYKMVRTGVPGAAYEPVTESWTRGATLRGAIAGTDLQGNACVYFTDTSVGLCRVGIRGIEDLARDIRVTWRGRNPEPAIGPRLLHYPLQDQVWFTLPVGTGDVIQTAVADSILTATGDELLTTQTAPGLMGEFEVRYDAIMLHDSNLGQVQAMALAARSSGLVPVLGTPSLPIVGGGTSFLHYGDTGATDSGTNYRGYVQTKQFTLGGLWHKFEIMAGIVLAKAAAGTTFLVKLIRNWGVETKSVTADLTPAGTEAIVVRPLDNATLNDLNVLQVEYGDSAASAQTWDADEISFRASGREGSAG